MVVGPTERFRVVHVVPHWPAGGLGQVVETLHDGLPSRGFESEILVMQSELDRRGAGGRRFSWALARLVMDVQRDWRRNKPSAVLAHTVGTGLVILPLATSLRVRKRVQILHGDRRSIGGAKTSGARLLLRTRFANQLIFVGEAAARSFGRLGLDARAVTIRNGISLPKRRGGRRISTLPPGSIGVVAVSRLVPTKKIDVVVQAVMDSSAPLSLTVCGDGPEQERLRMLAAEDHRVTILGHVPRDELSQILEAAEIFVFPSSLEGMPLSLIEAAQQGLAVVARSSPISREVLSSAGMFIGSDNSEEWRLALEYLVENGEYRQELQELAHARGRVFDPAVMVREYAEIIAARRWPPTKR